MKLSHLFKQQTKNSVHIPKRKLILADANSDTFYFLIYLFFKKNSLRCCNRWIIYGVVLTSWPFPKEDHLHQTFVLVDLWTLFHPDFCDVTQVCSCGYTCQMMEMFGELQTSPSSAQILAGILKLDTKAEEFFLTNKLREWILLMLLKTDFHWLMWCPLD